MTPEAVDVCPIDMYGRPCYLPSEYHLLSDRPRPTSSLQQWKIVPSSFVVTYDPTQGMVRRTIRARCFTVRAEVFHSVMRFTPSMSSDPAWFPALSELWSHNPLASKTLTCSKCGQGQLACYFCPSPLCHSGRCFH